MLATQTPLKDLSALSAHFSNESYLDELAQSIADAYRKAMDIGDETCKACRTGGLKTPCPSCGASGYCSDHMTKHIVLLHSSEPVYTKLLGHKALEHIKNGRLSAVYTPDTVTTVAGTFPNPYHSAWFLEADHFGFQNPMVITLNPPRYTESTPEAKAQYVKDTQDFLDTMDLRAYDWTSSDNAHTLFAAMRTDTPFLPRSISDNNQESPSGYRFKTDGDQGKIPKRKRSKSIAEGAFWVPRPSPMGVLELPNGYTHKVAYKDTKALGDGSGMYRKSSMMEFFKAAGITPKGDYDGVYVSIIMAEKSVKALLLATPDEQFPDPGADLIVDTESLNNDVTNVLTTGGKAIPVRHKTSPGYIWVQPLYLSEPFSHSTDPKVLAARCLQLAANVDNEATKLTLSYSKQDLEDEPQTSNYSRPDTDIHRAITAQQMTPLIRSAYELTNYNPFASPWLMDRLSGQHARQWAAKRKNSWPLPGTMADGDFILVKHPFYAGVSTPRKGYIRLVWHPVKEDELTGFCMSAHDYVNDSVKHDTHDCDDHFYVSYRTDGKQDYALVLRAPLSIGGGSLLKLNKQDARKLRQMGRFFYPLVEDTRYPDLHDVVDGEPLYPDVLKAEPLAELPRWTTEEDLALVSMYELSQFRGAIGPITDRLAILDKSGAWDPRLAKMCLSTEAIDPAANASKNPYVIIPMLEQIVHSLVRKGTPVCECMWPRLAKGIQALHEELGSPGGELKPKFRCPPHHHILKKAMTDSVALLDHRLARRLLLANGPSYWLNRQYDPALVSIALGAYKRQTALWKLHHQRVASIRKNDGLDPAQKRKHQEASLRKTMKQVSASVAAKQTLAKATVEGYLDGDFMGCWWKLLSTASKRFSRQMAPVKVYSFLELPEEEYEAFYTAARTMPTALISSIEQPDKSWMDRTGRVKTTIGSSGTPLYTFVTEDGDTIARLGKEAQYFTGHTLTARSIVPAIPAHEEWEPAQRLLLFDVDPKLTPTGE